MAYHLLANFLAGTLAIFLISKLLRLKRKSSNNEPTEPPFRLPVLGHLHLFSRAARPYKALAAMADRYGSVFLLRLGVRRVLVVSSWELAKECFTTNDRTFATRPRLPAGEHLGYNYAMFGFAPYDHYWREMRKIVVLEFVSNRRIEKSKHVRALEVEISVRELFDKWAKNDRNPVKIEMKKWVKDLTFNLLQQMIAGKRYFGDSVSADDEEDARRFRQLAREFGRLLGANGVSDALPFLKWMDLQGHERDMKRVSKGMDSIIQGWVDEHRRKNYSGDSNEGEKDFIDVMLSRARDGQFPATCYDNDTIIKATVMILIVAGVDTVAGTLVWALALLLNNRHVLKKAQDELDVHVGKERVVDESDVNNLNYIQAIIKETMRLYPVAPLLLPHEAMEDCNLGGYNIQRGTRLLVNVWKINRDPRVWSNPEEFQPDRFLESDMKIDIRGQHFELIPFGSGRRSCPGISLALNMLHLIFARLLQSFQLTTLNDESIDMEELGFFISKRNPFEVLVTPRLDSGLY